MKQTSPIRIIIVGCVAMTAMVFFIAQTSKSETPLEMHVNYILEKHNDNCQSNKGECKQIECSNYDN